MTPASRFSDEIKSPDHVGPGSSYPKDRRFYLAIFNVKLVVSLVDPLVPVTVMV
jgi:hypothetical protein